MESYTTETIKNEQSGNNIEINRNASGDVIALQEVFENGVIIQAYEVHGFVMATCEDHIHPRYTSEGNPSFIDALSDIAEYLDDIGVHWSFPNFDF